MKARHAPDEDKALHHAPEDKGTQPPEPVPAEPIVDGLPKRLKRRKKQSRRRT